VKDGKSSNNGGSSGSFFFFTEDNRCIVKTISKTERNILLKFLKAMVESSERNGNQSPSLLAQIYGIYEIRLSRFSPVNVMVMKNIMQPEENLSFMFDLKGSLVKRQVSRDLTNYPLPLFKALCEKTTLKDRDLINIIENRIPDLINLSREDKVKLEK
jgi:hypothetical protein